MNKCDMCGSKIENSECDCGTWATAEEAEKCPIRKGIEEFHKMRRFIVSGDAPHLGCAVVYFRGDFNECEKVKQFIKEMKGRPHYEGD